MFMNDSGRPSPLVVGPFTRVAFGNDVSTAQLRPKRSGHAQETTILCSKHLVRDHSPALFLQVLGGFWMTLVMSAILNLVDYPGFLFLGRAAWYPKTRRAGEMTHFSQELLLCNVFIH